MPIQRAIVSAKQKLNKKSEADDNESIGDERKTEFSVLGIRSI